MKAIDSVMKQLGVLPRLQLAIQVDAISKNGKPYRALKPLGPKQVKFVSEPTSVMGKDFDSGRARQELKFTLEHEGRQYRWLVPIHNKNGEPNYLIERLAIINVGDEAILEMKKSGANNYVEITKVDSGEVSEAPGLDEDEESSEIQHEEE